MRAVARGGILFGPILDPVPGRRCSARMGQAALLIMLLVISGCVRQAAPAPPVQRTTPPSWDAPRDAVSYIKAAGLEAQPLNSNGKSHVIDLRITFDGAPVEVPAYVGIDRVRALQAPVHTHDGSGRVWLEGRETDAVTLAQFFTVWGVRFDRTQYQDHQPGECPEPEHRQRSAVRLHKLQPAEAEQADRAPARPLSQRAG
jgi:hypothetical protein